MNTNLHIQLLRYITYSGFIKADKIYEKFGDDIHLTETIQSLYELGFIEMYAKSSYYVSYKGLQWVLLHLQLTESYSQSIEA